MTQRIELLPPGAYFRFLEPVFEGKQAFTHAALLHVDKRTRRYYIKCYRDSVKPIFNEISGFLLAAEIGLPQADSAALIALPGGLLERIHAGKGFSSQSHWLCWGTTSVGNSDGHFPAANTFFQGDFSAIADDLRTWKCLPTLLAFDEWVANVDRNTGNLIRISSGDYAIIDHGAVLTGPNWIGKVLNPIGNYTNKILQLLHHCYKGIPLPLSNSALHASSKFLDAYLAGSPEIRAFGKELLDDDDLSCCDMFLRNRSLNINNYLRRRLGVLI